MNKTQAWFESKIRIPMEQRNILLTLVTVRGEGRGHRTAATAAAGGMLPAVVLCCVVLLLYLM